jgi:peptidoglycan L-alanyl-D-glutamate endopeptidase CwlK
MPKFGKASLERLWTCKKYVQELMDDVIAQLPWTDPVSGITINDISIICGHRTMVEQDLAFKMGHSKVKWPDSEHNQYPSPAVDVTPYHDTKPHIRWKAIDEMEALSRLIITRGEKMGLDVQWGGDWDRDGIRVDRDADESFLDGPHYRIRPK